MITRLPRWIWMGGAWLALVAGMINTMGLLGSEHRAVTHLTGTATMAAAALAQQRLPLGLHLVGIVAAFVAGAILSAILIRDSTLRLGRRYGFALIIEALLLCVAVPLFTRGRWSGDYFVAAASGLQNAMATTYSGAILRTTHVTGIFTDIGILLGHWLRGERPDGRKLRLLLALAGGFVTGSAIGALFHGWLGMSAFWIPTAMTGFVGIAYTWYRHRQVLAERRFSTHPTTTHE